MKIILGINSYHADSSACIVKNGKVLAAIEEERINRIKHWAGFPEKSIRECIKLSGINYNEITDIAINTKPTSNLPHKFIFFFKNYFFSKKILEIFFRYKKRIAIKNLLLKEFNFGNRVRFHFIDHHIAHISSAFYPSNFEKAVGLTIDGSGDFSTLTISECSKNKIKIIKKILFPHSLGIFYEAMTQFIGFRNYGDEYKLMGLAPYGRPIYQNIIQENILKKNNKNFFKLNLNYFNHNKSNFSYKFDGVPDQAKILDEKIFKLFGKIDISDDIFKKNFAASVQKSYENIFQQILNFIKKNNYSNNLVFAGGCALNSSANKEIIYDKYFKSIFIPFAPGDGGGAIGAALYVNNKHNKKTVNNLSPYLGSSYTDNEVLEQFEDYKKKLNITEYKNETDLIEKAVEMLNEQKVIGWFQGRMEFGPRALGNRSILADPRNKNMKEIINKKIKKRENFRPFAPSILNEEKLEWYKTNKFNNLYMSSVEIINKEKKKYLEAVTHVDDTGRLQSVMFDINSRYYALIKKFFLKTGIPVLLNTSFNENEPIVRTPIEAFDCLLRTDIDALFINNFKITKK